MNTRKRQLIKSALNVLDFVEMELGRIELYEICFKGGELEREGLLSGIPEPSLEDSLWDLAKNEMNIIFGSLDTSHLTEEQLEMFHDLNEDISFYDIDDMKTLLTSLL